MRRALGLVGSLDAFICPQAEIEGKQKLENIADDNTECRICDVSGT